MNINIDLGNLWEMLSALGTIGAIFVSLWMAAPSRIVIGTLKEEGFTESMHVVNPYDPNSNFIRVCGFNLVNRNDYIYNVKGVFLALKESNNLLPNNIINKRFNKEEKLFILTDKICLKGYSSVTQKVEGKSTCDFIFYRDQLIESMIKQGIEKNKCYISFGYVRLSDGKKIRTKNFNFCIND